MGLILKTYLEYKNSNETSEELCTMNKKWTKSSWNEICSPDPDFDLKKKTYKLDNEYSKSSCAEGN